MNKIVTLALTTFVITNLNAQCNHNSCKQAVRRQDSKEIAHEVGRNLPQEIVRDTKRGVQQTASAIKEDVQNTKNKVANTQIAQDAKEKADNAKRVVKEDTQRVAQATKEVASKAGQTIKDTTIKVGKALQEGASNIVKTVKDAKDNA